MSRLSQQQLEAHLWGAASILRGKTAGQDYKTYILSLLFFKRLSDQWDYEADAKIREEEARRGRPFTDAQRERLRSGSSIHRFKIPDGSHWKDVLAVSVSIGEALTKAMKDIAKANEELVGVFTVDWNQPAPDGRGETLIPNAVVSALVQHFNGVDLSNANVQPDVLGRAYEYLIKKFADDAGAKAGEFFTPPEVVDILIRILEPQPGETVYDPTCGSGGMLVHSADFLAENGHRPDQVLYRGQEMNWSTYAIARINMILHGLEADIRGGKSTLTDPSFVRSDGSLDQFDVVISNFPFSDDKWWLTEKDQHGDEEVKKAKKARNKDGFTDKYNRFVFGQPPASSGDYAFIQHIVASATSTGRCGVVCPQGVLFRGQPEVEEESGELDGEGNPIVRRRKADDEHLIRRGLLEKGLVEAVIALPLNIFYGAGVPACLLILRKKRPRERQDRVLLVYAARHFRELSSKNQLRPQDVMRILVHYHAYGDARKATQLTQAHSTRLLSVVDREAQEDAARVTAEYEPIALKVAEIERTLVSARELVRKASKRQDRLKIEKEVTKLEKALEKPRAALIERDERLVEIRRRADEERKDIRAVADELLATYSDPSQLGRHARVVELKEIEENDFNLNIPRYVDTFEPEEPIDVTEAVAALVRANAEQQEAHHRLLQAVREAGYDS